ncbi:MAG TPA: hypothetical protein VE871_06135 [Longimicrobium sp.]|nr:hypothetical protein [Longimicrobium sp.]
MKSIRQKTPKPRKKRKRSLAGGVYIAPPRRVPTAREIRFGRWMAFAVFTLGAVFLLKATTTLISGTAWDDMMSASRETDPGAYWSFVGTFVVLGGVMVALSVHMWNER